MSNDLALVTDTRAWLQKAETDLRAAEVDLAADPPLLGDAAFHCQQAAEKSLKAFLTWKDRAFRKTHDLAEVGELCVQIDPALEPICRTAERLTVYAWTFRYPGDPGEPTLEEAREALGVARAAYDAIRGRLPLPEPS